MLEKWGIGTDERYNWEVDSGNDVSKTWKKYSEVKVRLHGN